MKTPEDICEHFRELHLASVDEIIQIYRAFVDRIHDRFRNLNLTHIEISYLNDLHSPIRTFSNRPGSERYLYFHPGADDNTYFVYDGKNFDSLDEVIAALKEKDDRPEQTLSKDDVERYKIDWDKGRAILQKHARPISLEDFPLPAVFNAEYYELPHTGLFFALKKPDFESFIGKTKKEVMFDLRCLTIHDANADLLSQRCKIRPGSVRAKIKAILKKGKDDD